MALYKSVYYYHQKIVLKPADEIRFLCQIKVLLKYYIIRWC